MNDPFMNEGCLRWIQKTAVKNLWRVPEWYAVEDLISDGYVCFYKCKQRYGERISKKFGSLENPPKDARRWFMVLLKVSFLNHINTLSKKKTACHERAMCNYETQKETPDWTEKLCYEEEVTVSLLLKNAPSEIRQMIELLVSDSAEYLTSTTFVRDGKVCKRRVPIRETTAAYIARLLGRPEQDCWAVLSNYFGRS